MSARAFRFIIGASVVLVLAIAVIDGASPSTRRFQGHFQREFRAQFPGSRVLHTESLRLECDIDGYIVIMRLDALFRAWKSQPGRRRAVVHNYLTALCRTRGVGRYSQVHARIFPFLRHEASLALVGKDDPPVTTRFHGHLVIAYCVDFPDRMVLISRRQLLRWRISRDDLHREALANLLNRTRAPHRPPGSPGVYAFLQEDGYDAARILVADRLRERCGGGLGPLYAAIPHRDALYILNPSALPNPRVPLDNLRALSGHLYRSSHHGLWPGILQVEDGKVTDVEF